MENSVNEADNCTRKASLGSTQTMVAMVEMEWNTQALAVTGYKFKVTCSCLFVFQAAKA